MSNLSHNGSLGHTVYTLIDPRTDEVRYVGISGNAPLRLKAHLQCDGSNSPKDEWIQELKDNRHEVVMKTLEVVNDVEEARKREQHWIQHYYSLGAILFNREVWDSSGDEVRSCNRRDSKKYVYLTIGILRDSQTHLDLKADAEECNTKQLPTVAALRLGDYYRMRREGLPMVPASSLKSSTNSADDTMNALSNAAEANNAWPE